MFLLAGHDLALCPAIWQGSLWNPACQGTGEVNFHIYNKTRDKIPCRSGRCFKMFQGKINFPVPVQSSLGGPGLRALFLRILSKPWAIPKLQPGSGLEGPSPSTWAGRNRNLQKPAVFGTDVHQMDGSIRIQPDCVMRPSPNIPNVWNCHGINLFGPVVQLTPLLPCPRA